jgi:hypothetical protein
MRFTFSTSFSLLLLTYQSSVALGRLEHARRDDRADLDYKV